MRLDGWYAPAFVRVHVVHGFNDFGFMFHNNRQAVVSPAKSKSHFPNGRRPALAVPCFPDIVLSRMRCLSNPETDAISSAYIRSRLR